MEDPKPPRTLVTLPGKLGDIIYALPAALALARRIGAPVHFLISTYAHPVQPLLEAQPDIADCRISEQYQLEHVRYGCQPYLMPEPPGFDPVYHLGFRPELLGKTVLSRPLIQNFYYTLEKVYGLDLPPYDGSPYIEPPAVDPGDYIVFQGRGQTHDDLIRPEIARNLDRFWQTILDGLGLETIAVCGPDDPAQYGLKTIRPADMLETARLIQGSRLFLGVQSAAAAAADGLKVPRLIYAGFANAMPTGPNGLSFSADADPAEVLAALKHYFRL